MLAPDFTVSQLLFGKYGFDPGGSVVQQSFAKIALYNFAVARVLNLLVSGNPHMEHPFSVVSPDKKKLYSIRTLPTDIAHALTDPRGFFSNRMSPALRGTTELLSGKDSQGKAITTQKAMLDLLRNVLPIPSQGFVPGLRREDEVTGESVARGLGVGVEDNRSTADRLAGQLASNHSESGPVDPSNLGRHQQVIALEDAIRTGKADTSDLDQAFKTGNISLRDKKAVVKNVQETRNMDAASARLYTRASRLPMKDFLQVLDVATPPEKMVLEKLLVRKRTSYLTNASQNMSLIERQRDPVYQRLKRMHLSDSRVVTHIYDPLTGTINPVADR